MTAMTNDVRNSAAKRERLTRLGILCEPMGYVDGLNLYEFVRSGPVEGTDPLGLAEAPKAKPAAAPVLDPKMQALVDSLKDPKVRAQLADAWTKTNPMTTEKEKAEHGGQIKPGAGGGVVLKPCPAGKPGARELDIPHQNDDIGTYHAHPDAQEDDPAKETHARSFIDQETKADDNSDYRPPTDPQDYDRAKRIGRPAIVIDRYYTYVYSGDGMVAVCPHPAAKTDKPSTPVLVTDKRGKALFDALYKVPVPAPVK